ncbi:peroxiredoxin [Tsuneonella mangrovi]|uniref:peroxiredoxin n=1 Tax=Tsuneonella mangrovi TaxID=1982042 RepID=UPI000BA29698|nr:peroxiredoxin [Tsuneonella mangrovi]
MNEFASQTTPAPPLRIGDVVPRFTARSTQGPIDLGDYDDRWVVLFAHPADFTPVCTSEFVALAKAQAEFEALGCTLIGLSVDSLFSHLAWVRSIYDMTGFEVTFPIVEDPTVEIARAYGMVGGDAADATGVRTTYFISPGGVLRASICYPSNVGRSIPEMLRLLKALQLADRDDALVPADWQPGGNLLQVPGETTDGLFASSTASEWFYKPAKPGNANG